MVLGFLIISQIIKIIVLNITSLPLLVICISIRSDISEVKRKKLIYIKPAKPDLTPIANKFFQSVQAGVASFGLNIFWLNVLR